MSGYLQYSNYGDDNETPMNRKVSTQPTQPTQSDATKPTQQKRILRTNHRTLRSRPEPGSGQSGQQQQQPHQQHKYVQELIQKIHSYEDGASDGGDDDDNNYAPLASSSNSIHQQFQTESSPNRNRFPGANSADLNAKWNPAPAKEAFTLNAAASAAGTLAKPFNQPYVPSVFQASDTDGENKDILLQKLDHIISLLESQHDEKTGHVTEELVLYCFLGVFIIFIVDSFARAGKYVR
jgi:hypothetical protein